MTDQAEQDLIVPDVSHLVTEDDAPVDNIFQEKQMRLLVEPLYSSWRPVKESGEPRRFVAAADVGSSEVFTSARWSRTSCSRWMWRFRTSSGKRIGRSYYLWEFGRRPRSIEIVSNREGEELEAKRATYSKLRIAHYVVFDVTRQLGSAPLHVFELRGDLLVPANQAMFPGLGLGLTEWSGSFEGKHADWLRWCRLDGEIIPTGHERAELEHERAERLAQKLRELGIEPE